MYELKVRTRFAAAHRLAMVGHKCENLHGHNWTIEVVLKGDSLDGGGVLMDFGIAKKHLAGVMDSLDHKFLNELPAFLSCPPSSENIARIVAVSMAERIDSDRVKVYSATAWESEDSAATYIAAP
ncbi:MAG: 6-carboxytetrahydropterin synthase [Deltaproteobacteria bacterium]|nr:6-carboxytetrahydropterin synthase [Deltaproteobacteria bacterium]